MSSLKITFEPIDTLFFRDGSPFNRKELQANINMIFPPSPATLAGAIRAAWARAMGWDGKGSNNSNWDDKCKGKLGGGSELASLKFDGCYLFKGSDPLFPAPAHLLGKPPVDPQKGKPTDLTLLTPQRSFLTDLGEYQLSEASNTIQGRKSLTDEWWITACGLRQILSGETPAADSLIHQSKLWSIEQRTGNYREDLVTRTTKDMALYSPQHIRLSDGISLAMYAERLDESLIDTVKNQPVPVGGESRMCWLDIEHGSLANSLKSDAPKNSKQMIQMVLTPLQLETPLKVNSDFANGKVINLCNPRPIMLGGWNHNEPKKLMPYLRAGSVIFTKTEEMQESHKISTCGNNTPWGFGRTISGIWK